LFISGNLSARDEKEFDRIPDNVVIDSIAIHKARHEMLVFSNNHLIKRYKVQLGVNPVGRKECAGDMKTPEGLYYLELKNFNSAFHKSLKVSYPNQEDVQRAKRIGKSPGGDIMIHGLPNADANVGMDRYQ